MAKKPMKGNPFAKGGEMAPPFEKGGKAKGGKPNPFAKGGGNPFAKKGAKKGAK